jgi:hypothetical protein
VSHSNGLTKVRVDLPNHCFVIGEYLWARPLGRDLYELRNVPMGAYGLNCGDVVRATRDRPTEAPEVRFVVRRSGRQTYRVFFGENVRERRKLKLMRSLEPLGVGIERGTTSVFALDLAPDADQAAIRDRLHRWHQRGLLHWETCEERRPGSFDDLPEERSG